MTKVSIMLLVDRSGSMANCKWSAENGIRKFIKERKKETDVKQKLSLAQFDTEYETVYSFTKIDEVPDYSLAPRGMTALHDSIMKAGKSLEGHKPEQADRKRFLVIMTDGLENSSVETTEKDVKEYLEKKQAEGWTVIYLGANQDAVKVGQSLGVPGGQSITYDMNYAPETYASVSGLMTRSVKGGKTEFFDEDRERALGK